MKEEMVKISRKEYDVLWDGCWYGAAHSIEQYEKFCELVRVCGERGDKVAARDNAKAGWNCRKRYIAFRKACGLEHRFEKFTRFSC